MNALPEEATSAVERAQWDYDHAVQAKDAARKALDEAERHVSAARQKLDQAMRDEAAKIPVDRSQRVLVSGQTEEQRPDYRDLKESGQQKDYVVLSDAERAKGFVRPVRRSYKHLKCGVVTTMGQSIAETYARDPGFYSGTFCVGCGAHFPVGEKGEFVWLDNPEQKVGT